MATVTTIEQVNTDALTKGGKQTTVNHPDGTVTISFESCTEGRMVIFNEKSYSFHKFSGTTDSVNTIYPDGSEKFTSVVTTPESFVQKVTMNTYTNGDIKATVFFSSDYDTTETTKYFISENLVTTQSEKTYCDGRIQTFNEQTIYPPEPHQ